MFFRAPAARGLPINISGRGSNAMRSMVSRVFALGVAGLLLAAGGASAAEVKVMISGGLTAAYRALTPQFERATGNTVATAFGPSMGTTPQAIPQRIARGEPVDVVIMVGDPLGALIAEGKVVGASRVDLVRSPIGIAVRAGAPKPDIGSVEGVKRALLAAKSIAYSDSASGVYVETELFRRLGIEDAVKGKSRMIPAEPVGQVVARGEAEIGFQQISELMPVAGIELVGKLPPELQKITVFAAGIAANAAQPKAGAALIAFLASPEAAPTLVKSGLEPIGAARN
jgi:molybdate transport system substrate-binding protein